MSIIQAFRDAARERPGHPALLQGRSVVSFAELAERTRRLAHGLRQHGVVPGEKLSVLLPPGRDFLTVTYAALAIGAVPLFLDPGLGLRTLLRLLARSGSTLFAGTRLAHLARLVQGLPGMRLALAPCRWPGCVRLDDLAADGHGWPACPLEADPQAGAAATTLAHAGDQADAPGLILYTSGATGAPKGITLSRATIQAQAAALRNLAGIDAGSVLLAALPAMALVGPALGCTIRIPRGRASLADDLAASTHSFASPAVWGPLAQHLERSGRTMPSLECLLFGGCAIDPQLVRRWRALAPQARLASVYGATEAVPLAWTFAEELLAAHGDGTLIGRPGPGAALELTPLPGHAGIGSICAHGPVVAGGARIDLGDLARQDDHGRWWFLGRTSERVERDGRLWPSVPVESRFLHAGLRRVALVGLGDRPHQVPVLVIEPCHWPYSRRARRSLISQTISAGGTLAEELGLTAERILLRRRLPLDARHRAKILRGSLTTWAATRVTMADRP